MIEWGHPELSVVKQCELIELNRSSVYYKPALEDPFTLELMRVLDEVYTAHPYFGSPRMTAWLRRLGYGVNRKRVERLMRKMGIVALYPRRRVNLSAPGHRIYPYLLKEVEIVRPNQVWAADITYVRMRHGFLYLVAVLDWFSRYVLSWELSNTLDASFCVEALHRALHIAQPEIMNTDQGSQFGSEGFTGPLETRRVAISMDGRGRAFDNIIVERLWRTVKYEEVYLKDYYDGRDAKQNIERFFQFYNRQRPHQTLDYKTPEEVYHAAA